MWQGFLDIPLLGYRIKNVSDNPGAISARPYWGFIGGVVYRANRGL